MRLSIADLDKKAAMADLKEHASDLVPEVCDPGRRLVWGEGPVSARVAIVGEAPGDKEDKLGRPFVGAAGKLLEIELARAGLDRADIWITNIVKCRPTRKAAGVTVNRPPTVKEINAWKEALMKELEIVSPQIIICAGAQAAKVLIRKGFALTKDRGKWFDGPFGARIIATYHPAYLLRRVGEDRDRAIAEFRSDLRQAADALR